MNIILFFYFIIAYSITSIITESYFFAGFRKFLKFSKILYNFINCQLCVSVWVGMILSYIWFSPLEFIAAPLINPICIFDGMLTSGCVMFLYYLETKLTK